MELFICLMLNSSTLGPLCFLIIGAIIFGFILWKYKGNQKVSDNYYAIIAKLLQMGKRTKNTRNLLISFYEKMFRVNKFRGGIALYSEAISFADAIIKRTKTIDKNFTIDYDLVVKKKDLLFRCNMVKFMFKLAAEGDGIKNDEWQYLLNTMTLLKINKRTYDYCVKYYSPLRTEYDDFSQSYNQESKKEYTAPSTPPSLLKQYYDILGVAEGASKQEIQKAYHALALLHHPDRQQDDSKKAECEKTMATLNDAYAKVMAGL